MTIAGASQLKCSGASWDHSKPAAMAPDIAPPSLRGAKRRGNPGAAAGWQRLVLSSGQVVVKIKPLRVRGFDQSHFLCSRTRFHLPLPRDCIVHAFVEFVKHKQMAAVLTRETFQQALSVLVDSLR
jgi:hypothetical protein